MSTLRVAAKESLTAGGKVQSKVREILADLSTVDARIVICLEMEEFKGWAEDNYVEGNTDKRKQVNNVINDISRICRQEAGFTIKCTKRSAPYLYKAETWTAPPFPKPKGDRRGASILLPDLVPIEDDIMRVVEQAPVKVMREMFKAYTPDALRGIFSKANKPLDTSK